MPTRKLIDRRELPVYWIHEVAYYLGIKQSTLHSWIRGRTFPKSHGTGVFKPLIDVKGRARLSFYNLVEAHVLLSTRKLHGVRLIKIRKAIDYVQSEFPSEHPLITEQFKTDGKDLFIEKIGSTINASRYGQTGFPQILDQYLRRIHWDLSGLPVRLFPFRPGKSDGGGSQLIVIDPFVSSGRPVLNGTGIMTSILRNRFKAGEDPGELARDYGLHQSDVEEAIEYFEAA